MAESNPSDVGSGAGWSGLGGPAALMRRASRALRRVSNRISLRWGRRGLHPASAQTSLSSSRTERMVQANRTLTRWRGIEPKARGVPAVRRVPQLRVPGSTTTFQFSHSLISRHRRGMSRVPAWDLPLVPYRLSKTIAPRASRRSAEPFGPVVRRKTRATDAARKGRQVQPPAGGRAEGLSFQTRSRHTLEAEGRALETGALRRATDTAPGRRPPSQFKASSVRSESEVGRVDLYGQVSVRDVVGRARSPSSEEPQVPQPVAARKGRVYRAVPLLAEDLATPREDPLRTDPAPSRIGPQSDLPLVEHKGLISELHVPTGRLETQESGRVGKKEPAARAPMRSPEFRPGEPAKPPGLSTAQPPPGQSAEMARAVVARQRSGRRILSIGTARLSRWVERSITSRHRPLKLIRRVRPLWSRPSQARLGDSDESAYGESGAGDAVPTGPPALSTAESHKAARGAQRRRIEGAGEPRISRTREAREEAGGVPTRRGQALEPRERRTMESLLEDDFGDVRIHTDSTAAEAARELQADAFAVGRDVFFATGRAAFHTPQGMALLGHELTHVRQTREAGQSHPPATALQAAAEEKEAVANEQAVRGLLGADGPPRLRWQSPPMDLPDRGVRKVETSQGQGLGSGAGAVGAVQGTGLTGIARASATRAVEPAPLPVEVTPAALESQPPSIGEEASIDLDVLAGRVYDLIMQRLTLERERVGYR